MQLVRKNSGVVCIDILDKGSPITAVVFDARTPGESPPPEERYGWGYQFLSRQSFNAIFVKPRRNDWYRPDGTIEALEALAVSRVIQSSDHVRLLGNSMGGFAAMTFSRLFGADAVLAVNPQSTLNRDKVPFETRFDEARKYNWSGTYSDAAMEMSERIPYYIVYDPFFHLDSLHIVRLPRSSVQPVFAPFIEHQVPHWLADTGLLKPLVHDFILTGNVAAGFQRVFLDALRGYIRYYSGLFNVAVRKGNKQRLLAELLKRRHQILSLKSVGQADNETTQRLLDQMDAVARDGVSRTSSS